MTLVTATQYNIALNITDNKTEWDRKDKADAFPSGF
jgi:hypothetical protein